MAEEFSYSNDIAPIKGDFFNTRPLSNRESDFIRRQFGSQNDKIAADIIQLQTARNRMRAADLAYESGLLDLEEKKDRARKRREEISKLGELADGLRSITENENTTPIQKSQELARKQMEIAAAGGLTSTATKTLFDSAYKTVSGQEAAGKLSPFAFNAVQQGMTSFVMREAMKDGNISAQEAAAIDYSTAVEAKNKAAASQKQSQEQIRSIRKNKF